MLFKDLVPMTIYRGQSHCPVPKGNPVGKGQCLFLLTPNKDESMKLLAPDTFLYYREGLYKRYYIDMLYHEKIGNKQVVKRTPVASIQDFKNQKFDLDLAFIPRAALGTTTKSLKNMLCDLGEWNDLYFTYRRKVTPIAMAKNYLEFLLKRVKNPVWNEYEKTIVIDTASWKNALTSKITFEADRINNPLTILLFLLYKEPDALSVFQDYNFLIMNSKQRSIINVPGKILVKENFSKLRSRISQVCQVELEVEKIEDIAVDEEKVMINTGIKMISDEEKRKLELRTVIKNRIAKKFTGPEEDALPEISDLIESADEVKSTAPRDLDSIEPPSSNDIASELDGGEGPDVEVSIENDRLDTELENIVDEVINTNDIETLEKIAAGKDDQIIENVTQKVTKRVFTSSFMPEYSKVQINRINKLQGKQDEIIKPMTSVEVMESKIIDPIDLSDFIHLPNEDFLKINFGNMDRSYNKKKLDRDIDNSVAVLSGASKKVFVIGKKVEDTSNQLTMKETRTYNLEDENGKRMTIKFDVPKIIDDNYVIINGNKKILQHQLVTKPIIKSKPNEVKINTFYNKLIITRNGREDAVASPLRKYLMKNMERFKIKLGNGLRKNGEYTSSIEYSIISSTIYSFEVKDYHFITSIDDMVDYLTKRAIPFKKPTQDSYPIGVNKKTKEVIYLNALKDSYAEKITSLMEEDDLIGILKIPVSSNAMITNCEIMSKNIPIVLVILHAIGLTDMLNRMNLETEWIPLEEKKRIREYDKHTWGTTQLEDGYLLWKREPMENSLLMNGVNRINFEGFTREEMDSKSTYIYALNRFYEHSNMSYNLDQFNDFMIDETTKEVLEDFHLPTNFIDLLLLANKMLVTLDFIPEVDTRNLRVRSNELIAHHVYKAVVDAYNNYRKTAHRMHTQGISIKQDEVIRRIQESSLTENESVLNPFLELEKAHAITYKGDGGISKDRAMSLDKRAYNESMLGIIGITTTPDAGVGIARQLTLEPVISSTRGYIDYKGKKNVEDLTAANLLTPGELLTPLGVEHDDPVRTAMAVKQSKYMIPIDESEPGMITNGVDRVLPYHMSKEFTIVAEDNGVIVEDSNNLKVIKYNNGRYQTIDTSEIVKKNSSAGFWIVTQMVCDKKLGEKVKKNEVVAYERQAFSKNSDDLSASMKRGPFVKIALIPRWDCYEDSNPLTQKCSDSLASTMSMEENAVVKSGAKVNYIVKIGDKVNSGDPLIKFENNPTDDDVTGVSLSEIISKQLAEMGDDFIDSTNTVKKAHYTGEIVDIKMYATVPLDQLSPSLQDIVGKYYEKLNKKIRIMKKYRNPEDNNYYMSGKLLTEYPEPIAPDARGLLKGNYITEGVLFCFFIKYKDYIKKGDKITAEFALKGIDSQVIPEGLEPYSEFRPDEQIGLIVAPHSPTARKTTAIFKSMFINKILIEKKRQLTDYWKSVRSSIKTN